MYVFVLEESALLGGLITLFVLVLRDNLLSSRSREFKQNGYFSEAWLL